MINHPGFFVRDAVGFADFVTRIRGSGPPLSFFFGMSPFRFRLHEFVVLLQSGLNWPSSPLNERYWSQTPYRIGSSAMKFSAKPISTTTGGGFSFRQNYLRESLTRQLASAFSFEFSLQLQTSASRMPIEGCIVSHGEKLCLRSNLWSP